MQRAVGRAALTSMDAAVLPGLATLLVALFGGAGGSLPS